MNGMGDDGGTGGADHPAVHPRAQDRRPVGGVCGERGPDGRRGQHPGGTPAPICALHRPGLPGAPHPLGSLAMVMIMRTTVIIDDDDDDDNDSSDCNENDGDEYVISIYNTYCIY